MKYRSTIVLFFVLTLTVSLLPTWPRPAPCLAAEFRIGTVTANVNLRKTPGLQGAVVAGLQKGLPVKVYGEKDSWYRVSANKNYTLINGWIYKRYVEIVSTQSGPARPEVSTPQPLPEAPSEKPLPALLKTAPLPEPAPVPEKTAPAKAPKLEIPPEKSALPAAQKHALPPTTGKTAPASSTKSTDTARLLLSISPLVLAIIALLVAARAFRAARTQGRKMEVPAALSPGNEPAALSPENDTTAEKPRISPEKPPVNEKRRATRLNRLIEVDFSVDGRFFRGFINNLSETGAYVDTPEQLAVGREITIACPDIHTGGHIKRAGLIVRLTPTGIGVHFQKTEIS